MTTSQLTANALASFVSLLLLWILLAWLYRDYRVDKFRQKLFALRDELFDFAAGGGIPFDHPAYTIVRQTINGHIRFGDRVGFLSLLLISFAISEEERREIQNNGFSKKWNRAAAELDETTRSRLADSIQRMHLLVSEQILLSSPLLLLTVVPLIAVAILEHMSRRMLNGIFKRRRPWFDPLDSAALEFAATA